MTNEKEAFWAGMSVAVIMLASGFSMLLMEPYTGFGAVILSMGVMTMMLSLMMRVLVIHIQKWMDYNARIEETVANILSLRRTTPKTQKQNRQQNLEGTDHNP